MSGSAIPPFRDVLSRGCKVHLMLGLRLCSPPQEPYGSLRAFDTPLGRGDLSPTDWGLLLGAPVLTETGLPPASLEQQDAATSWHPS